MFGNKLDDQKVYRSVDSKNIYENLTKASQQLEVNWHAGQFLNFQFEFQKIKQIIYCGSGYATLAGKILHSVSPFLFDVPFEVVEGYRLPKYADKNTLVIVCSFSGNDFESLSCYQEVLSKKSAHIVVTSGGKIKQLSVENHSSLIAIEDRSLSPGTDSTNLFSFLGACLGIFTRLSPTSNQFFQASGMVHTLEKYVDLYSREITTENNPAKQIAQKHKGRGVVFVGSSHLTGVAKTASHYLLQSSKTFAYSIALPEQEGFLDEPFQLPAEIKNHLQYIFLDSFLYPKVIKEQIENAKNKLLSRKEKVTIIKADSTELASQLIETLAFLILFSYYLSITNQTTPS